MLKIEPLGDRDVVEAAQLHRVVLDMEFLSRFGPRFMRTYYRAWIHSPGGLALVARERDGALLGVLLGASDPALHVRAMVRDHGLGLAGSIAARALTSPPLAKDLIITRARRYLRGLYRLALKRRATSSAGSNDGTGRRVGEITHVLVDPGARSRGVGRELVAAAVALVREAGVQELTLVTPPDMDARHFYERLGWFQEGSMQSQSGEEFLKFRLHLDAAED
ncbi:MAG: GNAT family N-acetyltransferase [Acidimicrobiaceae bacterium]|nr:GNAT family N-acetyltransferase [Acidimicrobiaceae bacterium]